MNCLVCGNKRFGANQALHASVVVDADGDFLENEPGGLEGAVYWSGRPFGPFVCTNCGTEYDDITEEKRMRETMEINDFVPVKVVNGDKGNIPDAFTKTCDGGFECLVNERLYPLGQVPITIDEVQAAFDAGALVPFCQ